MKILFCKDSIVYTEKEESKSILLSELDPKKLIDFLELCVSSTTELEFVADTEISPFSLKLKDLIENAFSQTSE